MIFYCCMRPKDEMFLSLRKIGKDLEHSLLGLCQQMIMLITSF